MAEDGETTCCCRRFFCRREQKSIDEEDETKPLLSPVRENGKVTPASDRRPTKSNSGAKKADDENKKPAKPKELKLEKFQITKLDSIFDDFARALNPFVRNRVAMETAEASFKEAVASLVTISPKAKFREYLQALKTELKEANIFVKIKGGVMVVVSEASKVKDAVRRAVTAINRILDAGKDLEAMPISVEKAAEDAVVETEDLDVMAILKQEFKHWYDASKILKYKNAFAKNVKMMKEAPGMVKEFCKTTRQIVVEIYRAFADEDEVPSYSDEESEENKDGPDAEDDEQSDSAEGAVGGKRRERKEQKGGKKGDEKEKVAEEGKEREEKEKEKGKEKKKTTKEKEKKEEDFHKKLEFKVVGVQDIDRVFTDLARAINPFVVTREGIQQAKEAFVNSVKQICNFEGKKEFKEYVKELKEKAKKGDITIYVDSSDGEVKITSVKGLEPPKIYRDAVKALNNLKNAGKDALGLEPDVQSGIAACIEDISHIDPKRDIKKGLTFKDLPKLVGKVKDLNENRKKVQQAPGIVKEFCRYLEGLITDVLEVLVEGKGKEDEEMEEEGDGRSDQEEDESEDKDKNEEQGEGDKDEDEEQQHKDEGENDEEKEEGEDKDKNEQRGEEDKHEDEEQDKDEGEGKDEPEQEEGKKEDKEEDNDGFEEDKHEEER